MKYIRNGKGFTLLELLIVIAIIGILIAIAIVGFNSAKATADEKVCKANQRTIEMGRAYYSLTNPSFGSSLEELEDVFRIMGISSEDETSLLLCPAKGTYTFVDGSSDVVCSIERHN